MRRFSKRSKQIDVRQFDLFGAGADAILNAPASQPFPSNDASPVRRAAAVSPPSHEAQVLTAMTRMLSRHWRSCAGVPLSD
jgi:hypothetical protein